MYSATINQTIVQAKRSEPCFKLPKKGGLTASWAIVNGNLICKWSVVET